MNARIRDGLAGFLIGTVMMGGLGVVGFDVANDGWEKTIAAHERTEANLKATAQALSDRLHAADAAASENAAVRTVLFDSPARPLASAWVVPGRLVPRTNDGHIGAEFAWLDADGRLGPRYQAVRDTAGDVLPATTAQFQYGTPAAHGSDWMCGNWEDSSLHPCTPEELKKRFHLNPDGSESEDGAAAAIRILRALGK